jgi:hypothetical protein
MISQKKELLVEKLTSQQEKIRIQIGLQIMRNYFDFMKIFLQISKLITFFVVDDQAEKNIFCFKIHIPHYYVGSSHFLSL